MSNTLIKRCGSCGGGATPFTGVRLGAPVRNTGAAGSRGANRILPFQANPTFRAAPLNAWSAWQQITAGELTDRVLVALVFSWTPAVPGTLYLEVGTGAAGAEVAIFDYGIDNNESGSGSTPFTTQYAEIPFIKVLANTRIAYRTYWSSASSSPFVGAYLDTLDDVQATQMWDPWVDTYAVGGEVPSAFSQPAVGGTVQILAGAAYTTIIANAAQKLLVIGAVHNVVADGTSCHGQLAIATGAAAAEVDHAYMPCPGSLASFRWFGATRSARPVLVQAGERLSARWDYNNTANNINVNFWVANAN